MLTLELSSNSQFPQVQCCESPAPSWEIELITQLQNNYPHGKSPIDRRNDPGRCRARDGLGCRFGWPEDLFQQLLARVHGKNNAAGAWRWMDCWSSSR